MQPEDHSKLSVRHKDTHIRFQAPALYVLCVTLIAAFATVAIFAEDKPFKYAALFFLFIGFMQVIHLLAAVLGFIATKND
jgi:hypothetical protein